MKKIDSFKVNHLRLLPGIYESRRDILGDHALITYDLRFTQPNREPVLNTAEIHTIEHLAATFLRNHQIYQDRIIYFGPMGCRTGFYLIVRDEDEYSQIKHLIIEMLEYIILFNEDIPGNSAHDCGNYLDHNLPMAKYVSNKYLNSLKNSSKSSFDYEQWY